MWRLENTAAMDQCQSGFCPGRGTETAVVILTDSFFRKLDQGADTFGPYRSF